MTSKLVLAGFIAMAVAPVLVGAQGSSVSVHGVAYDSLRREPLANAFVMLGGSRSATSDARGRFEFADVAPGVHRLDMHHAVLDSMGLPGVSTRVTVTDGTERATIAIPSFATLWRAACGERDPPRDSGFVYGTIRDARDESTVGGALVELSWSDWRTATFGDEPQRISQLRWWNEATADVRGEFGMCGVPANTAVRIQAGSDSTVSGSLDFVTSLRVMRRDLLLGPTNVRDSLQHGVVVGMINDDRGAPFDGAGIIVDDAPRLRTGPDGRFVLRDVPIGTRQIEVIAIGTRPVVLAVDLLAGQVANVAATLTRITTLDVVRVIGSPWQQRFVREFAERRKLSSGSALDSAVLERRPTIESVFSAFPSVVVRLMPGGQSVIELPANNSSVRRCRAAIRIDGWPALHEHLWALRPGDLAAVEVFARASQVPLRFFDSSTGCGMVLVWTKDALR